MTRSKKITLNIIKEKKMTPKSQHIDDKTGHKTVMVSQNGRVKETPEVTK